MVIIYIINKTDDSTFDTVFQSIDGDTLILRVHWPPSTLPNLTLAGVDARHNWLDARMRIVGYGPLQNDSNWEHSKMKLGAALHAVIQHLQVYPPQVIRFVDPGLIAIQRKKNNKASSSAAAGQRPSTTTNTNNHSRKPAPPPPPPPPPQVKRPNFPQIPTQLPELDEYTPEQLEGLLTDDLEFRAFCNRLAVTSDYHKIQKQTNHAQEAKARLELQEQLQSSYKHVQELQETLQHKVEAFQLLEQKQDANLALPSKNKVRQSLVKAKKQAFETSEQFTDEWDMKDDNLAEFCQEFVKLRKIHHIRAAKLELLERS